MSGAQWEEFRVSLIDLFENQGWTAKAINEWMRMRGYQTTERTIRTRLQGWGCKKYQGAQEKEDLCRKLLAEHELGQPLQRLEMGQIRRLQRYCREKDSPTNQDNSVLDILRVMEMAIDVPDDSFDAVEVGADEVEVSEGENEQHDGLHAQSEMDMSLTSLRDVTYHDATSQSGRERIAEADLLDGLQTPTPADPVIIRQPTHQLRNIEKLFRLGQEYYLAKLHEHPLRLHSPGTTSAPGLIALAENGTCDYMANHTVNREFWARVKNGFYWLKKGPAGAQLAEPEMNEAFAMIPTLCERSPPFPVLKDMYVTLAPCNTHNNLGLRNSLLQAFRFHAKRMLGRDDIFAKICHIFCSEAEARGEDGVSDDVAVTALRAMLDSARCILIPGHPDLFELQRMIVRLYRRKGDLSVAEAEGLELLRNAQSIDREVDPGNVYTRIALTELVYVLNAQGRYEESLSRANDVLMRAKINLGPAFPDERSIYAMEDAAEICDRLGRLTEGINFLWEALRAAIRLWGNQRSTTHILDKLQAMESKRYQLVEGRRI